MPAVKATSFRSELLWQGDNMDFGIALALGLLGSLHCAAMCGPLMVALPVTATSSYGFILQRIVYQLGRVVTYCLLGIIAGFVGKSVFLFGLQQWLSIALGVAILIGFFASGQFPAYTLIARPVARLKFLMSAQMQQRSLRSQLILGMLNGLLPCGLVYVALAGAASQGTIFEGVGYMALFGIGTMPTMLGISLSGRLFPLSIRFKLRHAIPIGVCTVAALLILRGMALGIPYVSPGLSSGTPSCCAAR